MNKIIEKNFQFNKLGCLFKINTNNILKLKLSFYNFSSENKIELKTNNLNEFRQNFRKKNQPLNNFEKKSKIETNSIRSLEINKDISFHNDESNINISKIPILKPIFNKFENKIKDNYSKFDQETDLVPQQDLIPNIRARGYFERDRLDTTTP
jgi:hypothetical protein